MKKILQAIQEGWDALPKEVKVLLYMCGAAALDELAKSISPDIISFIPAAYRIIIFNLIEVVIVEAAKRLKLQAE